MPPTMTCPICRAQGVAFEVQDAPAFYKDPNEPVLRLDCPNCHNYWLNAARTPDDEVVIDPATLATIEPLSQTERAYYSECVQRLIDHNCWLIIGADNADHFLGDWRWGKEAAKRWGFDGARLMISGGGFDAANRLFFVLHPDGSRHVLRLVNAATPPATVRTMMDWMGRLRAAGVPTLTPVAGLDGGAVQNVELDGQTRRAVVFDWIDGQVWEKLPEADIGPDLVRAFGRAVGLAHKVSATMEMPDWYSCQRYDGKCFTQYMTRLKAREHMGYSAAQLEGFEDLERRLLEAMETLGETRENFGMVPADLAAHNTLVVDRTPYLVDMMSFGWGYYLADLQKAIALTVKHGSEDLFLEGYETARPLPPGLDTFCDLFAESRKVAMHWFG